MAPAGSKGSGSETATALDIVTPPGCPVGAMLNVDGWFTAVMLIVEVAVPIALLAPPL
jgi:hypothetical protein